MSILQFEVANIQPILSWSWVSIILKLIAVQITNSKFGGEGKEDQRRDVKWSTWRADQYKTLPCSPCNVPQESMVSMVKDTYYFVV